MSDAVFLPALVRGLPPPPDAALDPYLDAAAACFARHGISRSAVADIAKEMGVSRTTVYRQVGSIDNVVRLGHIRHAETGRLVFDDAEVPIARDAVKFAAIG